MTIADYGSYISSAGCSIGGFNSGVNNASSPALINAVFVSGAGTEDANGLYVPNGIVGGRTAYINNASGVGIVWSGEEYRIGQAGGYGDLLYYSDNIAGATNTYPWDGIYITSEGSDPPPTVRQATTADS